MERFEVMHRTDVPSHFGRVNPSARWVIVDHASCSIAGTAQHIDDAEWYAATGNACPTRLTEAAPV